MKTMRLEIGDDGIVLVELDLPDRPQNLLSREFFDDLEALVARLAEDDALKGAIITSAKVASFIAGADLKDVLARQDGGITAPEAAQWAMASGASFRRLETCGKPVVAAIASHALGGGLEFALACHRRLVLDRDDILLGFPEVTLGLLPGAGGTQRLPRLIGVENALPLLLEGTRLSPQQAFEAGIIEGLAATEDDLLAQARAWIASGPEPLQPWDRKGYRIPGGAGPLAPHAARSFQATSSRLKATSANYPAPHAIQSAVYEGTQLAFDVGMRIEAKYFGLLMAGPVSANLVRTFLRQVEARKREKAAGGAVDPTYPAYAERLCASLAAEVAALEADGVSPVLIANAARMAGYGAAGLEVVDAHVSGKAPLHDNQPEVQKVIDRLLAAPASTASQCLAEGLVADEAMADLGSLKAIGFPAWTGGAMTQLASAARGDR